MSLEFKKQNKTKNTLVYFNWAVFHKLLVLTEWKVTLK